MVIRFIRQPDYSYCWKRSLSLKSLDKVKLLLLLGKKCSRLDKHWNPLVRICEQMSCRESGLGLFYRSWWGVVKWWQIPHPCLYKYSKHTESYSHTDTLRHICLSDRHLFKQKVLMNRLGRCLSQCFCMHVVCVTWHRWCCYSGVFACARLLTVSVVKYLMRDQITGFTWIGELHLETTFVHNCKLVSLGECDWACPFQISAVWRE